MNKTWQETVDAWMGPQSEEFINERIEEIMTAGPTWCMHPFQFLSDLKQIFDSHGRVIFEVSLTQYKMETSPTLLVTKVDSLTHDEIRYILENITGDTCDTEDEKMEAEIRRKLRIKLIQI